MSLAHLLPYRKGLGAALDVAASGAQLVGTKISAEVREHGTVTAAVKAAITKAMKKTEDLGAQAKDKFFSLIRPITEEIKEINTEVKKHNRDRYEQFETEIAEQVERLYFLLNDKLVVLNQPDFLKELKHLIIKKPDDPINHDIDELNFAFFLILTKNNDICDMVMTIFSKYLENRRDLSKKDFHDQMKDPFNKKATVIQFLIEVMCRKGTFHPSFEWKSIRSPKEYGDFVDKMTIKLMKCTPKQANLSGHAAVKVRGKNPDVKFGLTAEDAPPVDEGASIKLKAQVERVSQLRKKRTKKRSRSRSQSRSQSTSPNRETRRKPPPAKKPARGRGPTSAAAPAARADELEEGEMHVPQMRVYKRNTPAHGFSGPGFSGQGFSGPGFGAPFGAPPQSKSPEYDPLARVNQ